MAKLKTGAILLLTLLIIAAVACLPKITATVLDEKRMGEASFHQVQSIQLEIHEKMPSLGRLAMINRMDGVIELSESLAEKSASMAPEEVEEAALAALEPYIAAGLMQPFQKWNSEIRPLLGQGVDNPELVGIFWDVTFEIESAPEEFYYANLAIDDETGKLLLINYTSTYPIVETDRENLLEKFAEIYFTELDIPDYWYYATDDLETRYIGDNAWGVRYRFGDLIYGEVNVDLYSYEYGFYTEFPSL